MIELFFVRVDDDERVAGFESLLTDGERERAARFRFADDRRRAIVSRGALRKILRQFVDGPLEIVAGADGKPELACGTIEFNVSHSGELVAIAVADEPVGIDIERVRPLGSEAIELARRYFSPAEIARVERSSSEHVFFEIWTAKEAVVKALGTGLGARLSEFTVPIAETSADRRVAGLEGIEVCALTAPESGYVAALAAARGVSLAAAPQW